MAYPVTVQPDQLVYDGLELNLRGPSVFGSTTGGFNLDSNDGTSSNFLTGEETATLTLIESLSPTSAGPVWLCDLKGVKVVLKLFAEEFFVSGPLSHFVKFKPHSDSRDVWRVAPSPETIYYREAISYGRLQELQGTVIPRSHGFYWFVLPARQSLTPALGHITEFVRGELPSQIVYDLTEGGERSHPGVIILLKALLDAYNEMHKHMVAQNEIASRNISVIWPGYEGIPRIAIYDFSRANFGKDISLQTNESEALDELTEELGRISPDIVWQWLEDENGGKPLLERFYDALSREAEKGDWPKKVTPGSVNTVTASWGSI